MISPHFERLLYDADLTNFETYIRLAVQVGSSDVHFEPMPGELRIRLRIEGELAEAVRLPHPGGNKPHPCVVQIKARSDLSLQSRVPEDGRFDLMVEGAPLSMRVATMPQVWGEKVVIRIFDVNRIESLTGLGFREQNLKSVQDLADRSSGMLLVTGPTGSGKTTTLYSLLNYLNRPSRNLVTVEDPVEYFFYGVNQIQVSHQGVTFQSALRALLRHDPDVIMLGEIRDRETAETAFHAATTGHLVLTTVHAKDCIGALMRLLDLGVPPLILSQVVNGVVAQRLVPRLCTHCAKRDYHPPLEQIPTYHSVGCERCLQTGFIDRQGVQELLVMTDTLRKMLAFETPEEEFHLVALKEGMETLKEDALYKSISGTINYRDAIGISDEPLDRIVADMPRLAAYMEL
ncbi:MAG: GspE/PulE family protein [Vulcanimicrobiota bacterium]